MNGGLHSGLGAPSSVQAGPIKFNRAVTETVAASPLAGRHQVDLAEGTIHHVTLRGNTTLTFPEPQHGVGFTLLLQQDATGSRTVTWPSTVTWPAATAPTLTATASKMDVISFVGAPTGRRWLGFLGGLNY